jgi:hypothetical protein
MKLIWIALPALITLVACGDKDGDTADTADHSDHDHD